MVPTKAFVRANDQGLVNIPRIYCLCLGYCPVLSDDFVKNITKHLLNLETVDLEGAYEKVTTKSVKGFLDFENLLSINIKYDSPVSHHPKQFLDVVQWTLISRMHWCK